MLCVGWCVAADTGGTKFRLNIGAEGAYVLSLEYLNQFDSTSGVTPLSIGSFVPSLEIGRAINPRFSLFLRYSHFLIFKYRPYEKYRQLSYIAAASTVNPSEKFNNLYLSYSFGILLFWPSINPRYTYLGLGTTTACGYRVNNHFRIQIDMDYLFYSMGMSMEKTLINTISDLNSLPNGGEWFDIVLGLSAFWDIF